MRALLAVSLSLLLITAAVQAQDKSGPKPKPDTAEQAADKVLVAFESRDLKALKGLAGKDDPDPWLVASELCLRGEHDAADAFAKAAPRKDTEKLPAYVASRRGKTPNVTARKALADARKAPGAKDTEAALAALEGVDAKNTDVVSVQVLYSRGYLLRVLRRMEESAKVYLAAADAAERLGWLARVASALHESGMSAYRRSDWRGALATWRRRLALEESRASRAGVAKTLGDIGFIHQLLGAYPKALDYQERSLKLSEELGDRAGVALALGDIGFIHNNLGAYPKALEYLERSLKLKQELGDRAGVARALGNIGLIHNNLGAYPKALEYYERTMKKLEELGERADVAVGLVNIGIIHKSLGDYAKALDYQERALKLSEELGDRAGVALALGNIGVIHDSRGAYAKALEYYERTLKLMRELGDRAGVARALGNIGLIHERLGAYPKALEYSERTLKLMQELGDRAGVARALGRIGGIHESLGAYPKALEYVERALKLEQELGSRASVAVHLVIIAIIHERLGAYPKALEYLERSLKLSEELGDRAGVALALGNIGGIHRSLGAYAKALEYEERARALAAELGSLETEVESLSGLAATHLALGKPADAMRAARSGVEKLPLLVGGLAEEQSATARDRWAGLLETGVRSGMQLESAAEVCFFVESGRAGALLESLGGRKALGDTVIPEQLRREEIAARAAVLEAQARHGRATKAGRRQEIREARTALEETRQKVLEVVARIQREAKAAADVAYPKAARLKEIQAALASGEALVSYAILSDEIAALVVTREGSRFVRLAKLEETLLLDDPKKSWEEAAARLRKTVVEPLGLGKKTKRLLVSPGGALSYVPFAVLAPDRELVYVPSGTTYTVLLDERAQRGKEVLALGDPDYGAKIDPHAIIVMRGGRDLTPLPGTRAEVKAVGDVLLLDKRATEATFAGAAQRKRWRAVHLACHGLVNPERPQLSSLALTPDEKNDGFLTVLEVFRMKIPADLVVLSACETARGKVHRAEGIVGFTRAFMLAGAPRVIVSLWKVDDEATRALMVKFYELWNPKDGSKGLSTATALKQAQEFVASHEKWKHPFYWAAWQLWGLPD